MNCSVCKLTNRELLTKVEFYLDANSGSLSAQNKKDLIEKYPSDKAEIESIQDHDCSLHWNFHQSIAREARPLVESKENTPSLTSDIGKDEANALYELLNGQAATFNVLSKKINKAVEAVETEDISMGIVHPSTMLFYKDLSDSIRATVREIVNMNVVVNGSKNGALEGLKALAAAITGGKAPEDEKPSKLDTDEYNK